MSCTIKRELFDQRDNIEEANQDTKIAINSWTNVHPSGGYVFPKMAN